MDGGGLAPLAASLSMDPGVRRDDEEGGFPMEKKGEAAP
jgi:hypothetical protein